MFKDGYLTKLRERAKRSRVYKEYQLIGLEIASLLEDEKHKALYIKLAREYRIDRLLGLAKSIAEEKHIKNKGAYFMSRFRSEKEAWRIKSS